jgi:hypothetical protein
MLKQTGERADRHRHMQMHTHSHTRMHAMATHVHTHNTEGNRKRDRERRLGRQRTGGVGTEGPADAHKLQAIGKQG